MKAEQSHRRVLGALSLAGMAAITLVLDSAAQDTSSAPDSLSSLPVPGPENLGDAVVDFDAAVRLGKAWFWEMRTGSDGIQACATCHFHAGADPRVQNQTSPGPDGFTLTPDGDVGGPNREPNAGDWPFRQLSDPQDNESDVLFDTKVRFSSQGIHSRSFDGVTPGVSADMGTVVPDTVFNVNGINVRRVEPRNTPTMINAVFIHRIFWDGRASNCFNGVNPFGATDSGATVLIKQGDGSVIEESVRYENCALGSQGVGPELSHFEMSFIDRDFPSIGRKTQTMQPLALQQVHPFDGALGDYSADPSPGLQKLNGDPLTYEDMIREAFDPKFWDSADTFGAENFTQMERNHALFKGLALFCYQSTLVADQAPYDQWAEAGKPSDGGGILTDQELLGLEVFMNEGKCISCHEGPVFGGAAISSFSGNTHETLTERMLMANGQTHNSLTAVFGGRPQISYGPGGDIVEGEEPEEPEDTYSLPVDPRGLLIEIRLPDTTGAPIAWGTIPGQGCSVVDVEGVLTPGSNAPDTTSLLSEFLASWRFRADENCNMELSVDVFWTWPGLPEGDYWLVVGGFNIGTFHMREVREPAVYDSGFYNIGVRETSEDLGAGGSGPFGSFSLSERARDGLFDECFSGGHLDPPVGPTERVAAKGAFRAMSLRNAELTGPFMHNGGFLTLEQVVDFYTGGVHFERENSDMLDPDVDGISSMTDEKKAALVAFIKSLTDERVAFERAPFDHPSLDYPDGSVGDENMVVDSNNDGEADDVPDDIPAIGAAGRVERLLPFHEHELAPALTVAPPAGGLVTNESGDTDVQIITVALAIPVDGELTLGFDLSDMGELILEPAELVFTEQNWFSVQEVTVRAREDGFADGDRLVSITPAVRQSTDIKWMDMVVSDVHATTMDSGVVWRVIPFEAEDGVLVEPLHSVPDTSASGSQCVMSTDGAGDAPAGLGGSMSFEFTVDAGAAGAWRLWALAGAPDASSDSFWVKIDDAPWTDWRVFRRRGFRWAWSQVARPGHAPRLFDLAEGNHTLHIQHREDGAALDRFILTNDAQFVPSGAPVSSGNRDATGLPGYSGPAHTRR